MMAAEVDIVKVLSSCLVFSFMPNSILVSLVKMRLLACISHKCYLSLSTIRRTDASHGADAEDGDSTRNLVEFLQADGEERRILLCLARLKSVPFMLMAIFSREDHDGGDKFVVAVLFLLIHRIHPGKPMIMETGLLDVNFMKFVHCI